MAICAKPVLMIARARMANVDLRNSPQTGEAFVEKTNEAKTVLIGVAVFVVIAGALNVRSQTTPPELQSFVLTQVTTSPTKDSQGIYGLFLESLASPSARTARCCKILLSSSRWQYGSVRKIFRPPDRCLGARRTHE